MTFYVNAWLNRPEPFLSLHNKQTGERIAFFDKNSVQACLDQGDFCLQDLCSNEPHALQDLVKCLLLKHCSQQLYDQVSQWVTSKKGASLPSRLTAKILPFQVCL